MSSSPLIEVVFEVRFNPKSNFATELLIAINQNFGQALQIIHADGLHFPAEIKAQQQEFYYIPSYRVNYSSFSLLIIFSVSIPKLSIRLSEFCILFLLIIGNF